MCLASALHENGDAVGSAETAVDTEIMANTGAR